MPSLSPVLPGAEQRRVFHVAELEKLGVSQSTSYRRSRADGPWTRLAPGIVLAATGAPTVDDRIQAALLHAGPACVITGMHGARLHGLTTPPEDSPVHVLIPHTRRVQSYPMIIVERTTRMPQPEDRAGVSCAPPSRAVMDAARTWQTRGITEKLLVEATQLRSRCHPSALATEMERGSRRGTGLPREILRDLTVDLRSVAELNAFRLLRKTDLPSPHWNVSVFGTDGQFLACPDIWFDDVALAVEVDSFQFHFHQASYAETLKRNSRYASNGVAVLQVLPRQLTDRPDTAVASIRAAYEAAAARQRPHVTMRARP